MKGFLRCFLLLCVVMLGVCGCGSAVEPTEDVKEIDLSGINPDAAQEIRHTLEDIQAYVTVDDTVSSAPVIRQGVKLMGLAAGNSLVEEQVALVVEDWKQQFTNEEWEMFAEQYGMVYDECVILGSEDAETELQAIGLTLEGHEYCGNGVLDMVEWLYTAIR